MLRALLLSVVFLAAAVPPDGGAPAPTSIPACVKVGTESRYVPYGYNHVVILENGCSKPATCTVSTDVNPEKQKAEVASGTKVEVLTFMGAASATFNARVGCALR